MASDKKVGDKIGESDAPAAPPSAPSPRDALKRTVAETPNAKTVATTPTEKNFFPPRPLRPREPQCEVTKKPALLLAEFETSGKLLHAAERLRDAGYTRWDVHSPFPVHGMDEGMGLGDSKLGWIVLAGGLTGLCGAVAMIWWMNGVDYPLVVGGKPGFTLPASVPIMFELTILFSAFAAVLGMLHLNKLPAHYHVLFESERFRACSDDKFFVSIQVDDPKYHPDRTRALLEKLDPTAIELVEERIITVAVPEEDA